MSEKFVWDTLEGRLRPWAEVAARRRERARSSLAAPSIIRDGLDNVVNPVDGKAYDSKSAYYQAVKAAGCEIVGNEAEKMVGPSSARSDVNSADIGEALHKVKQGYKPSPEPYTSDLDQLIGKYPAQEWPEGMTQEDIEAERG
jgi:hypothetical protein